MNSRTNAKSVTAELFKEWIEKLSFRPYLTQRRKILLNPNVISAVGYPGKEEMSPLKFAAKGLLLIGTLASAIGWSQRLFLHEPKSSNELTDSRGRIENVGQQLHLYLDAETIQDDKKNEETAKSILNAPLNAGIQLDELQAVIEDQKRKLHGLPTKDSRLAVARVEVLDRVYKRRFEMVQQQHKVEPNVLPPSVVVQCEDAMDERLDKLNYEEESDSVTNVEEVSQEIVALPACAPYGTAFLAAYRDVEQSEANKKTGPDRVRAVAAIKILERAKELLKQQGEIKETTAERMRKLSEFLSPLLPAMTFILSGLVFRAFVRRGKDRPRRNSNRANDAYLYIVTSSFFWWNLAYAVGSLALVDLWKFSRLGLKPLFVITVVGAVTYCGWGIYVLRQASEKLEGIFSMQRPRGVWQIYRGRRKIGIDIIAANIVGSVTMFTVAVALTLVVMYYSGALKT